MVFHASPGASPIVAPYTALLLPLDRQDRSPEEPCVQLHNEQVPLQPMFDYVDSPSTTTTIACQDRLHGDATSTSLDDPGRLQKRVPLPSTLEDPVDPEHLRIMNTYFHYEMYLYRRRERLLPRRPVNAYFLYTAPNSFRP